VSSIGELRTIVRKRGRGRPARDRRPFRHRYPDAKEGYAFMAPWLLGFFGLTVGPMIASLVLSFTNYNLLQAPTFIGLANFQQMFTDQRLLHSLRVTATYVACGVPLQLGFALLVAIVLDKGMKGLTFYRSIFYLPSLLGSSVAVAILWRQVFGKQGLFNWALSFLGIDGPGWISNPSTALGTIIVLHVWTFGSPMVIFLAGLRQIPTMYYEAAQVDGASKLRQFFTITIPLLTPVIFFNLVLQIIGAFQSFTQAYIVSGGKGGPADSTLFYSMYLYEKGFRTFQMGYASAMAWFLLAVIAIITGINFWLSKYWVHYDD